jgi:riboflavin synthase
MFSGIVEESGKVIKIVKDKENVHFTLNCSFADELNIDQSLSHNGVCLTVVEIDKINKTYKVTAIRETLLKSNLGFLEVGSEVNLERSMLMNGRIDGHIVQGHVDQTATCVKVEEADGSWYFSFEYDFDKDKAKQGYMTVEKGSVTVNGVSLTVVNSGINSFQVAIIPYTYNITNFHSILPGSVVNIEFDIIGKYLSKLLVINNS